MFISSIQNVLKVINGLEIIICQYILYDNYDINVVRAPIKNKGDIVIHVYLISYFMQPIGIIFTTAYVIKMVYQYTRFFQFEV